MVWPNSDSQKCDKWSQRVLRDHHSHLPPSLTRPPVLTFPRDLRNQESFLYRRQRPLACECFRSIPKLIQRKRRRVIHHTPKSFVTSPSLNFHRRSQHYGSTTRLRYHRRIQALTFPLPTKPCDQQRDGNLHLRKRVCQKK